MGRSRIRRDYDTVQRNKSIALIAGAIALIVFWVVVVIWIGRLGIAGSSERAASGGTATRAAVQEETQSATVDSPATAQDSGGADDNVDGSGGDGSGDEEEPDPTHEDEPSEESPPGDWEQDDAPDGASPLAHDESSEKKGKGSSSGGKEDSSDRSGDDDEDTGSEEQQENFDPLGKNPKPGDLTQTDRDRATSAADRFVTAAYGYTGNSEEEYQEGVVQTSLGLGLFNSPGGERIEKYGEIAGEDGITAAAKLKRFEITETSPSEVAGVAYFKVGKKYNRYAEIQGESTSYRQELTLSPYGESYRVSAASVEEETETTNGKEDR